MSEQINLPFEIIELSKDDAEIAKTVYAEEFVQVAEKKWFTRDTYVKYAPEFYNFSVRPDDVWVLGYPRSGTTVSQEIVWLICNNVDTVKAKQLTLIQRFSSLEHIIFFNAEETNEKQKQLSAQVAKSYKEIFDTTERRFIKTHLPFGLLPQNLTTIGCKIIYLVRDPRDVIASNYVVYEKFSKKKPFVEFSVFWEVFKKNLVLWGPYFEHLKEAWELREDENILIIFYDELINNQKGIIRKIGKFLEKELSEENIDGISEYCKSAFTKTVSVDNKTDDEKTFVKREEKWRQYFVGDLEKEVEEWIKENTKGTDIRFFSNAENN